MDRTLGGVSAQNALPVNDWLTLVRAHNNLVERSLGTPCLCGCGHTFTVEDTPVFTMQHVRIEGEDSQELRVNWFRDASCLDRALHLT